MMNTSNYYMQKTYKYNQLQCNNLLIMRLFQMQNPKSIAKPKKKV
jgi:hypothetical protein